MDWFTRRTTVGIQNILNLGSTYLSVEEHTSPEIAANQNVLNLYKSKERYVAPWDRGLLNPPKDATGELVFEIFDPSGNFVREVPSSTDHFLSNFWDGRAKKILLRAAAGFGKTHLCERIVSHWCESGGRKPISPRGVTVPVYFKLGSLAPESDLEEELWKTVRENYCLCFGDVPSHPNVVLLLDGHNEAKPKHQLQLVELVVGTNDNSVFKNVPMIVTTRTKVDKEFLMMFDKHFLLRGLSEEGANNLVRKYYENSNCAVNFILPKFRDLFLRYNRSPMLLVMLCYLQRHHFAKRLETIEQVIYQCAFQIVKIGLEKGGDRDSSIERGLHDVGRRFLKLLHEKRFRFTRWDLSDVSDDVLSSALFRSIEEGENNDVQLEVIHPSFMEGLATNHVNEFWYSLESDKALVNFFPTFAARMTSYEIFVYRDANRDTSFKVIGECGSVGYFVWDFKDGSCIFSTSLDKKAIPRKMGDCTLNITFSIKFNSQRCTTTFLTVIESILPDSSLAQHIHHFVPQTESCSFLLNFIVNEQKNLCSSSSHLFAQHNAQRECCPWRKLRDLSSEVCLTFMGNGCNHSLVENTMRNLMDMDMVFDKETSNATEMLDNLKKYDTMDSSFVCTLASVARMGHYYLIDTKRWYAAEDLRQWSKKAFFPPKYSWNYVDLLVLTYESKEQADKELLGLLAK